MLLEVRNILRDGLKENIIHCKTTVYRGRKDKITTNGISFNTVNQVIKNPLYKVHNNTIIKLLEFCGVSYDEDFFKQNDIVKLLENEKV